MSNWSKLTDELRTADSLRDIGDAQVAAIIDVLTLTLYADGNVGYMEQIEFDGLLDKLPWIHDKQLRVAEHTAAAVKRAEAVDSEQTFKAVTADAAARIQRPEAREKVFEMAATLAWTDLELHKNERRALTWLAHTFGIADERAQVIIASVQAS